MIPKKKEERFDLYLPNISNIKHHEETTEMANYYGTARTNFFRVKSPELFEFAMSQIGVECEKKSDPSGNTHYVVYGDSCSGSFKNSSCSDESFFDVKLSHKLFDDTILISVDVAHYSIREKIDLIRDNFDSDGDESLNFAAIKAVIEKILPGSKVELDEKIDDIVEYDLDVLISQHLENGVVAVFMESGHEKMRYINGHAIAVTNKGIVEIDLNNIYEKASAEFSIPVEKIARCEYAHMVEA